MMKTKTKIMKKKSMLNKALVALAILFVATWYPFVWFTIATANSVGVLATASDMTFDSTMSVIIGFALTLVIYRGILPMIVE